MRAFLQLSCRLLPVLAACALIGCDDRLPKPFEPTTPQKRLGVALPPVDSVIDGRFQDLEMGTQVRFAGEAGDRGPQASTVRVL
jgi:hypothetical protein